MMARIWSLVVGWRQGEYEWDGIDGKIGPEEKHIHGHTKAETEATTTATHITFKSRHTLPNTLGQDLDIFPLSIYHSLRGL
jgi:hypothetical protein